MRDILFRGKRVDNEEWALGYYCFRRKRRGAFGQTITEADHDTHYIVTKDGNCYEVNPETVGQYTGLTDKNGKKIFEGDIVKNSRDVGLLYYKEKNSAFTVKGWEYGYWLWHDKEDIEVIGNIYDNPELLKEDKQ